MKKSVIMATSLALFTHLVALAQDQTARGTFFKPVPRNHEVKHAFEIEAVPIPYFVGGYHVSAGYRYKKFRFRASVIDAGTFNSESIGNTTNPGFRRYETKGSFGTFLGYFPWKNLETYLFLDGQRFKIKQEPTDLTKTISATTPGVGVSYQFFLGRYFYLQPGLHLYLREGKTVTFENGQAYNLASRDFTFLFRVGFRPWKKF